MMQASSSSATTPSSSHPHHLLHLSRALLQRILYYTEAEEVRSLAQSTSGRAYDEVVKKQQQASNNNGKTSSFINFTSFLSSLATRLDDRALLLRESTLRSDLLHRVGYQHGLDAMNTHIDTNSLLQHPFNRGFHKGASEGWRKATAQGILAAVACYLHTHADEFDDEDKEVVERVRVLNNRTNRELIYIPRDDEATTELDGDDTAKQSQQQQQQKKRHTAAKIVISTTEEDEKSTIVATSTSTHDDQPPPLESSTTSASSSALDSLPLLDPFLALDQLRVELPKIGLDYDELVKLMDLPQPSGDGSVDAVPAETNADSPAAAATPATAVPSSSSSADRQRPHEHQQDDAASLMFGDSPSPAIARKPATTSTTSRASTNRRTPAAAGASTSTSRAATEATLKSLPQW